MVWYIIVNIIYFKFVYILKFKRCWFYRWKIKTGIKNFEILVTQMMLLWQHYHNHDLSKTYNKEALLLVLFDVRIPSTQPEATWCLLKPESISCSQAFLSPYTTLCKCSWVSGAQTIEPFITGVCNCLGNWQPSWLLAQTVWPSQMAPSKSHITKEFLHFLSVAVSTIAEKHIYFSHQGICAI